jgi:hypothetical protein
MMYPVGRDTTRHSPLAIFSATSTFLSTNSNQSTINTDPDDIRIQITMAAMMEESIADLVPASTNSSENCPEDARIESLLTEKLMSGHALLEAFCPSCNTPLVKNQSSSAAATGATAAAAAGLSPDPIQQPMLISSHSFEPPFSLLPGIPYCVGCAAHVVMTEEDVRLLELCDSLKDRGMILVALGSDVETVRTLETNKTMDTEAEAAAAVQRIAARIQTTATAQQQQQQDADAPPANTTAAGTSTAPPAAVAVAATDSEEPILPVSALFCGSTASRQMVAGSPTPPYQEEELSMSSSKDAIAAADAALAMFSMDHEEEGVEADLGAHESFRAMAAKQEYDNDNHGDNHDDDDDHEEHKPMLSLDDEENDGDDEGTFGDTTVEETVTSASVSAVAADPVIKGDETTSPPQEEEKKDEDEEDGLGDYSVRYVYSITMMACLAFEYSYLWTHLSLFATILTLTAAILPPRFLALKCCRDTF